MIRTSFLAPRAERRRLWPALALIALLALSPAPALAATATPTPTPSAAPEDVEFTLAPVGSGVISPGGSLTVSVVVDNPTAGDLPDSQVTLSLGTRALSSRAELTDWLDGTASAVQTSPVATSVVSSVPAGSTSFGSITVDANASGIAGFAPGVYPLSAALDTPGGTLTSTSALIVPDSGSAGVPIAVIVPITAGPSEAGLLGADDLAELTSPGGALADQLDAVDGSAAILAVDPAIPAAIRALGSAAPESALEWLMRLERLQNSRFALQFGDADPAVQVEAGLPTPLQPIDLTAYIDPADFADVVAPTPTSTAAPTAAASETPSATSSPPPALDEDQDGLPDLSTLLQIGPARADVYWPANGLADAATTATLGGLGDADQPSLTLLSSQSTLEGASGATVPAHVRVDDADVLVYDADVSAALSAASLTDESALRGAALTAATAYLAFAAAETGGAPVAVALDRSTDASRLGLAAALSTATGAPGVTAIGLDAVAGTEPASGIRLVDVAVDQERVAAASDLVSDEDRLARFATILADPALLTGPERAEVLQLLGVAWVAEPSAADVAVSEHRRATQSTLDSVALMPATDITLAGANVDLRFWVSNDLPYPVELVLYTSSDDLRLDVQRATAITATAASNTPVVVPVQARLGSGDVTLDLQLRSTSGVAIGASERVAVSVRAEWEGVGLVALTIVASVLVILGAIRTVLKLRARRTARQSAAAPADAPDRGTQ